jgi:hypothetical protein
MEPNDPIFSDLSNLIYQSRSFRCKDVTVSFSVTRTNWKTVLSKLKSVNKIKVSFRPVWSVPKCSHTNKLPWQLGKNSLEFPAILGLLVSRIRQPTKSPWVVAVVGILVPSNPRKSRSYITYTVFVRLVAHYRFRHSS